MPNMLPAPKKHLGQNFLTDNRIIQRIIDACELSPDETVLEIGPGRGAITCPLTQRVARLIAVETDRSLADQLAVDHAHPNLDIVNRDFLEYDLSTLPGKFKVIGNIPYNISTPIIAKVIDNRSRITAMMMTVQYDFGKRLIAPPGTRDFSALSCFVQMYTRPKLLFKIAPSAFSPPPKIMSCFMRLDMRTAPAYPISSAATFSRVVRTAFQQRRKMLGNALAPLGDKTLIAMLMGKAGIDPQLRADALTLDGYAALANALEEINSR